MPKLPIISGKKLIGALKKRGFIVLRQRGSHVFVESKGGNLGTVIPVHGNEDLGKGLLRSILSDLEISVEDFVAMLR
jgi:predicted RNA binding protein YcfA (HicA-like mRNA interferase family)